MLIRISVWVGRDIWVMSPCRRRESSIALASVMYSRGAAGETSGWCDGQSTTRSP